MRFAATSVRCAVVTTSTPAAKWICTVDPVKVSRLRRRKANYRRRSPAGCGYTHLRCTIQGAGNPSRNGIPQPKIQGLETLQALPTRQRCSHGGRPGEPQGRLGIQNRIAVPRSFARRCSCIRRRQSAERNDFGARLAVMMNIGPKIGHNTVVGRSGDPTVGVLDRPFGQGL